MKNEKGLVNIKIFDLLGELKTLVYVLESVSMADIIREAIRREIVRVKNTDEYKRKLEGWINRQKILVNQAEGEKLVEQEQKT